MSMKRSRKTTTKPSQGEGSLGFNPPPSEIPKWEDAVRDKPDEECVPFTIQRTFARGDFVAHTRFGKGLVIGVEGSKIEVLFADGVRKLAHGVT